MSVTIEVSDYACPFCYLAEQALADAVQGRPNVDVRWEPFELHPEPTPTLRPEGDYLQSTWANVVYPMAERMGVPIVLPRVSPQPHTRLAFEGSRYADEHGLLGHWTERAFRAFFVEQRDIGDPGVLATLAADIGLPADGFREALTSGRYRGAHQDALHRAKELEVTVVPTFVVGDRRLEGMPTAEGLHRLLDVVG